MKLKKYLKKKKYLMQLLLTIAGFVCIPLIIMQLLMMEQSTRGYAKLNEDNIYEKLQESVNSFVDLTAELRTTAIKISQDNVIRKAAKSHSSDYTNYEVALRLDEYSGDDWTTGVWFHDREFVIYNQVKVSLEFFGKMMTGEHVEKKEQLLSFFEEKGNQNITSIANYDNNNSVIIIAKTVSFLSAIDKDATVFFVMKQEVAAERFYERFHDCSSVALMDSVGRFLLKGDDFSEELCQSTEFKEFLENGEKSSFTAFNGERYINIYKYKDVVNGYTCLVSIFEDNMATQLRQYVTNIQGILIVSLILMVVLLALTVNINYKPILRLTNKHKDKAINGELSELELIDSAFFAVDQKITSQKKLLTNFVIGDLLSGRVVDEKLLEEKFPNNGCYGSMVIALSGPPINTIQANKITSMIKERCGCSTYITSITYRPQLLMVCIFGEVTDSEILKTYVAEVLFEITGKEYGIRCGNVVERVTDLRVSYLKTLVVSEGNNGEGVEFDAKIAVAIQQFGESLYSGDAANIQKLLDVVESQIADMKGNDALKRYYCYKLLSVYFANAKDTPDAKEEMGNLIDFCDTTQLFGRMRQSVRRLCSMLNENEQATANKLRKKLLDYVDVNFNNQNLCLTSAADYLETSIYVISRLFKEATGKGFKEYITDKRLEYARELLQTTNYNVTEVAAMSGFENTTYFSSVFKTKYGMPPTQYRKKHQE